jgi:hypothetical protein
LCCWRFLSCWFERHILVVTDAAITTHPSTPHTHTTHTHARTHQAYVEQADNFYSMLTVAETLTTAAQLQLSPDMPAADKDAYVDNLTSVLGLAKVWHAGCAVRGGKGARRGGGGWMGIMA